MWYRVGYSSTLNMEVARCSETLERMHRIHGVTSQTTGIFIATAVRTAKLALLWSPCTLLRLKHRFPHRILRIRSTSVFAAHTTSLIPQTEKYSVNWTQKDVSIEVIRSSSSICHCTSVEIFSSHV